MSHAAPTTTARDSGLTTPIGVGSVRLLDRSIVAALFVQENGCYAGLPGVDAISSCNPREDGL